MAESLTCVAMMLLHGCARLAPAVRGIEGLERVPPCGEGIAHVAGDVHCVMDSCLFKGCGFVGLQQPLAFEAFGNDCRNHAR